MASDFVKRDRTARLLRVEHLLSQHPNGLSAKELAGRLGVTIRTVYRDLRALEDELGFPVWEDSGKFGAEPGAFLPPMNLTLPEAVTLYLSARLMARYSDRRDDNVIRAFGSLAGVLPAPIAQHIYSTIASISERPADEQYGQVFGTLIRGWAERKQVAITYSHLQGGKPRTSQRVLSPYFIEPHPGGHSCYVLGHDSLSGELRTFKVERIQSASLTTDSFEVPREFDAQQRLREAWVVTEETPVEIRLLFHDAAAAARARENRWHTSQQAIEHSDGKLELRFTVAGFTEIQSWVLGWGDTVEVLHPPEFRTSMGRICGRMADHYQSQATHAL